MAHGITDSELRREYFDSKSQLKHKLDQLTQWILESRHVIVFTGPGAWELRDNNNIFRPRKAIALADMQKAIPSPTHMALVELQRRGIVKCVISQNCDGLHLRSGINSDHLVELHGNINLETCQICQAKYLRDFDTDIGSSNHYTGRRCDKLECGGPLKDSIINFGESLPDDELKKGFEHAEKADLCLVLGSSLTVTPASDIPRRVAKRKQKLIVVNLQRTPLYDRATMNIHAFCDQIMQGLMARLDIPIPKWILRRRVRVVSQLDHNANKFIINIEGRDPDNINIPFTLFKSIQLIIGDRAKQEFHQEPFTFGISDKNIHSVMVRLHFFGHYNEIPFDLHYINAKNISPEEVFYLLYNPLNGQWRKTIDENDLPITTK